MGKRTSDFVALGVILGGASIGLGLTSLFARAQPAPMPRPDDATVNVEVLRRSIVVEPRWMDRTSRRIRVNRGGSGKGRVEVRYAIPSMRFRTRISGEGPQSEQLERLMADLSELQLEGSDMADLREELSEALEDLKDLSVNVLEWEALEGLELNFEDLELNLEDLERELEAKMTIQVLTHDEDEGRKRRRRRRPR
jgi:hypothetical protein